MIQYHQIGHHNNGYDIYKRDLSSGKSQRLTDNNEADKNTAPGWSPDGKYITFVSDRGEGIANIYIMDADGTNIVPLTLDQTITANYSPIWQP